jgi:hypothetical protein
VGNGLERDSDGKLRTNIPGNEAVNTPLPIPYFGNPITWGAAIEAIRGGK